MDRGGTLCRQSRCCNSESSLTALPQLRPPEEECLSLNFSLQDDEEEEDEEEDEVEEDEVDAVEEDEERLREVAGELALLWREEGRLFGGLPMVGGG
jgi:hypothetical protein